MFLQMFQQSTQGRQLRSQACGESNLRERLAALSPAALSPTL